MQKNEQMLTLEEVIELPVGSEDAPSWVNPGFQAVVRSIKRTQTKKGQTMNICTLGSVTGSAELSMTVFQAVKFNEGDLVEIGGQGLRRTEYNGLQQVTLGKNSTLNIVGKSAHHHEQVQRKEAGQPALNGEPQRIEGQTVGMSIKEAIALALAAHREPDASPPKPIRTILADTLFWADVKTYSGNIIRISRSLCNGHLSPPSWPVAKAETSGRTDPPKPVTKPKPGPEGSAFPPSEEAEDDIPF